MTLIDSVYVGELRCRSSHQPSGTELDTDAPTDNQGKGERFSPTDLVATALSTCMLTIMGIVAERHGWSLEGCTARVEKSMTSEPPRRIALLTVWLSLPEGLDDRAAGCAPAGRRSLSGEAQPGGCRADAGALELIVLLLS
jgi:putative redox protein